MAPSDGQAGQVPPARVWFARAMVGIVFAWNVLCAVQFVAAPAAYAPAYGLPPTPESYALVAGMGVAFLMWNVTYPAVLANPLRFRTLFVVVLAQQAIGLVGETYIYWQLMQAGMDGSLMAGGILRFVAFDGAGLAMMLAGFLATRQPGN